LVCSHETVGLDPGGQLNRTAGYVPLPLRARMKLECFNRMYQTGPLWLSSFPKREYRSQSSRGIAPKAPNAYAKISIKNKGGS
jgi:hypothetical protein